MRIIVTGGIGCGKSTVCRVLHALMPEHVLISADQMVHDLYAKNQAFQADLQVRFGTLERKVISGIVFADGARRAELEALSWQYLQGELAALREMPDVIFEFPLYFESPAWHSFPDAVVALGCDEATQRKRVLARDGISEDALARILAAQLPLAHKVVRADIYVDTSGSLESVLEEVQDLPERLLWLHKLKKGLTANANPSS